MTPAAGKLGRGRMEPERSRARGSHAPAPWAEMASQKDWGAEVGSEEFPARPGPTAHLVSQPFPTPLLVGPGVSFDIYSFNVQAVFIASLQ